MNAMNLLNVVLWSVQGFLALFFLAAGAPKLPRGRPGTKAARRAARRKKRIEAKVGELFAHRHLFVQRPLTDSQRRTLRRISRGLPQLRTPRGLVAA